MTSISLTVVAKKKLFERYFSDDNELREDSDATISYSRFTHR